MPRTPRRQSRVRYNLPLGRQNTVYSDTSSSTPIRNVTQVEVDIKDEEFVANWLMSDGAPPSKPYRMHVLHFDDDPNRPSTVPTIPAPLISLLLNAGASKLGWVPPDEIPPPIQRVEPPIYLHSKLRKTDGPYYHPNGEMINRMGYKAFYAVDEQEYVIPPDPSSNPEQDEIRISVTRDYSPIKLAKHREDQLLIYRVPTEDQIAFGMTATREDLIGLTVRRPQDAYDPIRVQRHGHTSWDIGGNEEVWYLLGKNLHVINRVYNRIKRARPSLSMKLKRVFWKGFGMKSPARTYELQ